LCGTQLSEKVKSFPSTIVMSIKKRNKINPSEKITPLPSTRVILK
jgi:hypothetical protein